MKLQSRFTWSVCVAVVLVLVGSVGAQQPNENEPAMPTLTPEQMEEQMAWMKAGTPNENHERLSAMVGHWDALVKRWNPGMTETMEAKGTCTNEWILNDHYVLTKFKGDFMGMPFEGAGIVGYNNVTKRYFSTWIDTMSTGMKTEYGQYDEATKTYTYTGTFEAPLGKTMKSKSTIKMVSRDEHLLTMYHGESELEKVMEITYKRQTQNAKADSTTGEAAVPSVSSRIKTRDDSLLVEAREAIIEGNAIWKDLLSGDKRQLHEDDLKEMRNTLRKMEENFKDWEAGQPARQAIFPQEDWLAGYRSYTKRFVKDYGLDDTQVEAAMEILRDIEARAKNHLASIKNEESAIAKQKDDAMRNAEWNQYRQLLNESKAL